MESEETKNIRIEYSSLRCSHVAADCEVRENADLEEHTHGGFDTWVENIYVHTYVDIVSTYWRLHRSKRSWIAPKAILMQFKAIQGN